MTRPLALLCAAACATATAATGAPAFRSSELSLAGTILFLRAADVTGDARDDLVVVLETVREEERSRTVEKDGEVVLTVEAVEVRERAAHVFAQSSEGTFAPPARVVAIAEAARGLDAADVDGDGTAELLLLLPDRLDALGLAEGGVVRTLVTVTSILSQVRGAPLALTLAKDLDGDGPAELLVPHADSLRVYWGMPGGLYGEPVQVPLPRLPSSSAGGAVVAGFSVPLLVDATGDGVLDLLHLLPHGELVGYAWKRPGVLAQRTISGSWPMKGGAPGASRKDAAGTFERRFVDARDVDGDGRVDVVMLREQGGEESRAAVEIVKGAEDLSFPAEPSLSMTLPEPKKGEGLAFCTLEDLDGDGKMELLPTLLRTGAMQMLRAVVTKRADLSLRTPIVGQSGGALRILATLEDELPVSLRHLSASYLVTVSADVDGDGKKDLVRPRGDRLELFAGRGDGTFAGKPLATLPAGDDGGLLGGLEVADLDRDGRDDLMLVRESLDKDQLSLRIFVSSQEPLP